MRPSLDVSPKHAFAGHVGGRVGARRYRSVDEGARVVRDEAPGDGGTTQDPGAARAATVDVR